MTSPPTSVALNPAAYLQNRDRPAYESDFAANLDRMLRAGVGRYTFSVSPIGISLIYLDWLLHFSYSPGKQWELLWNAMQKYLRFALYAGSIHGSGTSPAVEPPQQDHRFSNSEWQNWPFNIYYQSFLLLQQMDTVMNPASLDGMSVSLKGKKGLVAGIANEHSLAFGCARAFRGLGADLAVTYLEKSERWVRPLAEQLESRIFMPCDVQNGDQLKALFERIAQEWGRLDFVLHSLAFAPKEDLHSRVVDCSAEGFAMAMDVSCHSFIRMARLAEPLMTNGGCLLTMSYYGSEKVIDHYNLMGPVKAALESVVRYMAYELGPNNIRVHALSPGPVKTRAASGIDRFDEILNKAAALAPEHRLVYIEDIGAVSAFLVGDWANAMSGNIAFVDAGYHVLG